MTTTTHPCPHCGSPRDLAARVTGDSVLCADCGGWFTVYWQAGGVRLLPASTVPPDAVPERRKRGKR